MTRLNEDVVGVDSSIFMHPTIWKASGHVDSFNDPMLDNKDSKKRYRADVLLEEHAAELEKNGETERAQRVIKEMARLLDSEDLAGESATVYLRPETAQGIFVNFLNVQKSARKKIPFGIAQIGKAFRNEIVARQFIFRMREFEQMEMQFFIRPGDEMQWYEHWKNIRMNWHKALGVPAEKLRTHDHEKLAHYANAALDIEYEFPFGFKEVEGIHSRTDFDLANHQEFSKKKLQYFDPELNKNYVPYVVETSVGADRLFLMILCNAYTEEEVGEGENKKTRTYLKFHPALAPIKAAVLPLV